jgi:hypothetical protein
MVCSSRSFFGWRRRRRRRLRFIAVLFVALVGCHGTISNAKAQIWLFKK